MTGDAVPICFLHKVQKQWLLTTFEYSEDGITVCVPNVYAWICPADRDAAFTPETVDGLITTVRKLLESAK